MDNRAIDAITTIDIFLNNLSIPEEEKQKVINAFDVLTKEIEFWKDLAESCECNN